MMFVILLFVHNAFALSTAQEDRLAACYQLAGREISDVRKCQDTEYDAVVGELEASVARFRRTIKESRAHSIARDELARFRLAEHNWAAYRDSFCQLESQPKAETQRKVMMGCLIQISRLHIEDLERLRQNYLPPPKDQFPVSRRELPRSRWAGLSRHRTSF